MFGSFMFEAGHAKFEHFGSSRRACCSNLAAAAVAAVGETSVPSAFAQSVLCLRVAMVQEYPPPLA